MKLAAISQLPSFRILSVDSIGWIDTDNLKPGCPSIFIYFSPDCEHCQKETQDIVAHQKELIHTRIYLLANEPLAEIKKFRLDYHLDTMKNVFVGKDYEYSFYKHYLPQTTPYVAIYNSKKNLVKIYSGETNIEFIIKAIIE